MHPFLPPEKINVKCCIVSLYNASIKYTSLDNIPMC